MPRVCDEHLREVELLWMSSFLMDNPLRGAPVSESALAAVKQFCCEGWVGKAAGAIPPADPTIEDVGVLLD